MFWTNPEPEFFFHHPEPKRETPVRTLGNLPWCRKYWLKTRRTHALDAKPTWRWRARRGFNVVAVANRLCTQTLVCRLFSTSMYYSIRPTGLHQKGTRIFRNGANFYANTLKPITRNAGVIYYDTSCDSSLNLVSADKHRGRTCVFACNVVTLWSSCNYCYSVPL